MNKKLFKLLTILFFILLIISIPVSIVKAGLISDVRGDSGPAPDPPTPGDSDPGTTTPGTTTPSDPYTIRTVTTYITSIEGYVYEDIGETFVEYGENPRDSQKKRLTCFKYKSSIWFKQC